MKKLISFGVLKKTCRKNKPNGWCHYYCGSMVMSVQDNCTAKNCPVWKKLKTVDEDAYDNCRRKVEV